MRRTASTSASDSEYDNVGLHETRIVHFSKGLIKEFANTLQTLFYSVITVFSLSLYAKY